MKNLNTPLETRFGLKPAPGSFLMRMDRRDVFICRDFRHRYYRVNLVIDYSAGVVPGHFEVLMFRK